MNMTMPVSSPRAKGLNVLEATVAVTVMAIAALAIGDALITSELSNTNVEEYAAAHRAARERLDEAVTMIKSCARNSTAQMTDPVASKNYMMVGTYGVLQRGTAVDASKHPSAWEDMTFDVVVRDAAGANSVQLQRINPNMPVGEVLMATNDGISPADLGRDIKNQGKAGGVTLANMLPFDLNRNGIKDMDRISATTYTAANSTDNGVLMYPVGAVVKWQGRGGKELTVECWTVVNASRVSCSASNQGKQAIVDYNSGGNTPTKGN